MRHLTYLVLMIGLVACAPRRPAKVDEIGTKPHRTHTSNYAKHQRNNKQNQTHKVVKGDSLYSIGFRYHVDYKTLAQINNIKPPYRIYPGQTLQLTPPKNKVFKPTQQTTVQTQPLQTNRPINAKVENKPTNNNSQTTNKSLNKPITQTSNKPINQPVNKPIIQTKPQDKPPTQKPVKTPIKTNLNWLWPTEGKIRTTFLASNPARKGISIGGDEGQPVKAAEAGVVVYSGNGLLGYGELVIIKHNDTYLSAYGHNKTLKVKEGENVTRGQVIAELGSSGTNVNNLHFEIRKNGQPVNPLDYVKP
ncbi:MAG: peptidoglycan DD-metalloendopeptidase family protein [Marinicella sp.]|nr:peptidoglycan DD-metalloendopeptidase family protein [Xanthomonadales bacterium]